LEEGHRAAWEQAKGGDFKAIDKVMRCANERLLLLGVLD